VDAIRYDQRPLLRHAVHFQIHLLIEEAQIFSSSKLSLCVPIWDLESCLAIHSSSGLTPSGCKLGRYVQGQLRLR